MESEFVDWLERLRKAATSEAFRKGVRPDIAADLAGELVARYWDRFSRKQLCGPLPSKRWKPELSRLIARAASEQSRTEAVANSMRRDLDAAISSSRRGTSDHRSEWADVLKSSVARFATAAQAQAFEASLQHGVRAPRRASAGNPRLSAARFSENRRNAFAYGIAGSVQMALEDPRLLEVILDPSVQAAHGFLSADVFRKWDAIQARSAGHELRETAGEVWERAFKLLFQEFTKPTGGIGKCFHLAPGAFCVLFLLSRSWGAELSDVYQAAFQQANEQGLTRNPYFLRQLLVLGGYTGKDHWLGSALDRDEWAETEISTHALLLLGGTNPRNHGTVRALVGGDVSEALASIQPASRGLGAKLLNYNLAEIRSLRTRQRPPGIKKMLLKKLTWGRRFGNWTMPQASRARQVLVQDAGLFDDDAGLRSDHAAAVESLK